MAAQFRKLIGPLVRWSICIAAVVWLAHAVKWDDLKQVWHGADRLMLVASLVAFLPAPLLIAVRLKCLLGVHKIELSVWEAIKVTFAGNFIINALPVGTLGGDSAKAYYVARETEHKHEAVTTVFFDRLVGVVGLVGLSGIVVLANWSNQAFAGPGRAIGVLIVLLGTGSIIYFSPRIRELVRLDWLVARMPLAPHLQRIDRAVLAFRHAPGRLAASLILTVLLQGACILSIFLAGWALGLVGGHPLASLPVYLAFTPITLLAGVMPIGVMEGTFWGLFVQAAGLGSAEAAVSLSLFSRFVQLFWSLPGSLVVLRGRPSVEEQELMKNL